MSDTDLHPPRPLTAPAREIFDRHAQRIDTEGRWNAVDHDLLAAYAECTVTYLALRAAVELQGVLVTGRNSGELVKNPALPSVAQTREAMMRLAKAVPLVDRWAAAEISDFDKFLNDMS